MQIKDMKIVNQNMHFSFLQSAFSEFLKKDSFVDKIKRSIGEDIDYSIGPDELFNETGMRASDPVTSIFYWLSSGEEFELEWLFDENGNIYSDSGEFIKPEDILPISSSEIMAAYGEWIITENFGCHGSSKDEDIDENGRNGDGWEQREVKQHEAECLLLGYQALIYARRLNSGEQLTINENSKAKITDYSAMGRNGAKKRHASMNKLKQWTIDKYKAGTWQERKISASAAAHELKAEVLTQSVSIGAHMKEYSAQNTIAGWIRKLV